MKDAPPSEPPRARRAGRVLLVLLVLAFLGHRVLVALSAGDFLFPLQPAEGKNTQIAWDLMSGRFGTDGYTLGNYVINSGSIHHASYSSGALVYWLISRVFGFTLLSVRLVAPLAWVGAMLLWGETLRRRIGVVGMALALFGLAAVPMLFIGLQLTFMACHPESVLPLAATIAAWLAWLDAPADRRRAFVLGACVGYSLIFSYLFWPLLALMAALSFLRPWPRPSLRSLGAALGGGVLGLWPLWLILGLGGLSVLFGASITENPETTLLHTAGGLGLDWEEFRVTFWGNLPYGFDDYWMAHDEAPRFGRLDMFFEEVAYRVLIFGPLLLLPWAATDPDPLTRRVGVLTAIAPVLFYAFLCFGSPFKPHVPVRYFLPVTLLGFSAPGVGVGLALRRLRRPGWLRGTGAVLLLACGGWLVTIAPPRWHEATAVVRTDRSDALLKHRYVAYYNLGIGTVWAGMVDDINDMIDVRTASGDPAAFQGFQAGLWGSGGSHALGQLPWQAPEISWGPLRAGLSEWGERDSYASEETRDDPRTVARNTGWGAGLRADWDLEVVAEAIREGRRSGEWPDRLSTELFWQGLGEGYGRARPDATEDELPASLSPDERESLIHGMRWGRALGEVPEAPTKPLFPSIRGPAT